jgi:hypothetical protein
LVGLNAGLGALGITGATVGDPIAYDLAGIVAAFLITNVLWILGIWLHARRRAAQRKLAETPASDGLPNQL